MHILAVMSIALFSGLQELIFTMCRAVCFPITRVKDPLNYSFEDQQILETGFNSQELSYAQTSAGMIKLITKDLKTTRHFISKRVYLALQNEKQ